MKLVTVAGRQRRSAAASILRTGEPHGPVIRFPIPAFIVEAGQERILIDTGLHPAAVANPVGFYGPSAALDMFALEQERTLAWTGRSRHRDDGRHDSLALGPRRGRAARPGVDSARDPAPRVGRRPRSRDAQPQRLLSP
jgi:hypothetical protein